MLKAQNVLLVDYEYAMLLASIERYCLFGKRPTGMGQAHGERRSARVDPSMGFRLM
jgi:hypothetical protein